MTRRISILLIGLLGAAALVAGCGGGGTTAGTTSNAGDTTPAKANEGPPSRAEFVKQAEAICQKTDVDQDREGLRYRHNHHNDLRQLSPHEAEVYVLRSAELPLIEEELAHLRELTPPPAEAKEIKAYLAAIEAGLNKANKHPYSVEASVSGTSPFSRADELGKAYGFVNCENVA
jgi:hypothetical protein